MTEYISVLRGFQNGNFYSGTPATLGGLAGGFRAAALFLVENDDVGALAVQSLWENTSGGLDGWSLKLEPSTLGPASSLDVTLQINGAEAARAELSNAYAGVPMLVEFSLEPGGQGQPLSVELYVNGIRAVLNTAVPAPYVPSADSPTVGGSSPAVHAQILGVMYHEGAAPAGVTPMSFYKACRAAKDMVGGNDTLGAAADWTNRWSVRSQLSGAGIAPVGTDGPLPPLTWLPSAGVENLTRTGALLTVRGYKNFDWDAAFFLEREGPPEVPNAFAMFYGLTAGTGGPEPTDYPAPIAAGAPVQFPRLGPTAGGANAPSALTDTTFNLPDIGTYEVSFAVHATELNQLQLRVDGVVLPETTATNMNPTSGGHPIQHVVYITTAAPNLVLEVINPAGNSGTFTVTPADGAQTHANAQILLIKRIG